jgi:hypothetical protein
MKKIHKLGRMFSLLYGYPVRPLCKVDNKTYSYHGSTNWNKVDCKKCLALRKNKKENKL